MRTYHCIMDDALACLKPGEFSIFYFIYRKTIGWNKYVDRISLTQFMKDTGLSRPTVVANLDSLEENKWIYVMREETEGGLPFHQYALGKRVYITEWLKNLTSKETLPVVVKKLNQKKPKVVKKLYPQKIVLKEKEREGDLLSNKQDRILENGMMWSELLAIGNTIMIGAFDQLSFGNNADWMRYIETQPKENILTVADMEYVKSAKIRYVIERMYEELKKLERVDAQKPVRIPAPILTTEQLLAAGHPADYYTREDAGRSTPVNNMV